MNIKAELALRPPGNGLGGPFKLVNTEILASVRLKKLRRERQLVERAIIALTEVSRARESRDRRAARN
jgi:hypothetical protein